MENESQRTMTMRICKDKVILILAFFIFKLMASNGFFWVKLDMLLRRN